MTKVTDFLTKHCQACWQMETEILLASFINELDKALVTKSSLPAIPTYLTVSPDVKHCKNILIDAGGTNFRSAIGYFDADNKPVIEQLSNTDMPGVKHRITAQHFFDSVADNVKHLLDVGNDVGFCFSYAVDMKKDIDGYILDMSKEVMIDGAVGLPVGKSTIQSIAKLSSKDRQVVVLNDTVATLLGGYANTIDDNYCSYIGYIFGTGTNLCYIEKTAKIKKIDDYDKDSMIINVEAAHFNKLPLGDYDKLAIANSSANNHHFEKITSGRYLAEVIKQCLIGAIAEGLFDQEVDIAPFDLKDISYFLAGEHNVVYNMFRNTPDRSTMKELAREMIDRAAKLGAIINAAIAMRVSDKKRKVAIVCEGSTFNKLVGYKANFIKYLDNILGSEKIGYDIIQGDKLNLIGTLMATMVVREQN